MQIRRIQQVNILMVFIFEGESNGRKQTVVMKWRLESKLVSMSYL